MLRYSEMRPCASLRHFVESLWMLEHDGQGALPQRVMPDGHPELILNFGHPFEFFQNGQWHDEPRCFFAGQISGPLLLRPHGSAKILGIRFHPHGAARLLSAPMHELNGKFTPIMDLVPELSQDLNRAMESDSPMVRVQAALQAAEIRQTGDPVIAAAVRRMVVARGAVDLVNLSRELGMGIRQLERRFHTNVGLPPKFFCRMQRFLHVFRIMEEQSRKWVDAAVDCGYYDQAHLIRDCKDFSGVTPAVLLAEDADLARHFLLRFGVSHSSNTAKARLA